MTLMSPAVGLGLRNICIGIPRSGGLIRVGPVGVGAHCPVDMEGAHCGGFMRGPGVKREYILILNIIPMYKKSQ